MSALDAARDDGEDEYDALPDAYAGIDFDSIEALCGPARPARPATPSSTASTEYAFDELDEATLAEVDAIVARALQGPAAPTTIPIAGDTSRHDEGDAGPSTLVPIHRPANASPHPKTPSKRRRTRSCTSSPRKRPHLSSPTRSHKQASPRSPVKSPASGSPSPRPASPRSPRKIRQPTASQSVRRVLEEVGDELTCPICCDLFVYAHVGSTCGHSYCGDCGWDWVAKTMPAPSCPYCRTPLNRHAPLIPNFAVESMVQKHIATLAANGVDGWDADGEHRREWLARQERWKAGAAARAKELEGHNNVGTPPPPPSPARTRRERQLIDLSNEPDG
ncbi:Ring finger domain-containing protein [Phanerochaete sordida]|uniref:Ring finger domain-containing protein n=1 Tax=Phanerochaete sordida TaxID=48140 RepID=A0A9P3G585_9APHY|nr:Ring finger domain-containing protein [Phanerochaete sordida]